MFIQQYSTAVFTGQDGGDQILPGQVNMWLPTGKLRYGLYVLVE